MRPRMVGGLEARDPSSNHGSKYFPRSHLARTAHRLFSLSSLATMRRHETRLRRFAATRAVDREPLLTCTSTEICRAHDRAGWERRIASRAALLSKVGMLRALSHAQRRAAAAAMRAERFAPGQVVCEQGTLGDACYFILSGVALVEVGAVPLCTCGETTWTSRQDLVGRPLLSANGRRARRSRSSSTATTS